MDFWKRQVIITISHDYDDPLLLHQSIIVIDVFQAELTELSWFPKKYFYLELWKLYSGNGLLDYYQNGHDDDEVLT